MVKGGRSSGEVAAHLRDKMGTPTNLGINSFQGKHLPYDMQVRLDDMQKRLQALETQKADPPMVQVPTISLVMPPQFVATAANAKGQILVTWVAVPAGKSLQGPASGNPGQPTFR